MIQSDEEIYLVFGFQKIRLIQFQREDLPGISPDCFSDSARRSIQFYFTNTPYPLQNLVIFVDRHIFQTVYIFSYFSIYLMQNQTLSYSFQLNDNGENSFLACHSKSKQIIASNCLKSTTVPESFLYSLKYDEENPRKSSLISKKIDSHVIGLFPLQNQNSESFFVVSSKEDQYHLSSFKYSYFENEPQSSSTILSQEHKINKIVFKKSSENSYLCENHKISLFDLQKLQTKESYVQSSDQITNCSIDPIHEFLTYSLNNSNIVVCDKNSNKQKFIIKASKEDQCKLNGFDYNPNKQYYLMTSHQECLKFWDIRKGSTPIKIFDDHHNLILSAKYNHSHDQLIAASYDDGSVGLLRVGSVSSAPSGDAEDCLVNLYDQHEDAVYQLSWASFSPWIFVSLPYNSSNIVINLVSSVQKYRILL